MDFTHLHVHTEYMELLIFMRQQGQRESSRS